MHILALEPYYGGSHRAFLDGWSQAGRHQWTLLSLPAYKWKWRMRHAAVTFAADVAQRLAEGEHWDALFCSDMLNLAEFRGLVGRAICQCPTVVYFHENQLTYPVRVESERDYQFAMTNLTTALAADAAWFNSAFHRDTFLAAMEVFLKRMPDHQPTEAVPQIRQKAEVYPPGIATVPERGARAPGPLRIVWAARWEHDKNPDGFFAALRLLKACGAAFRISVIGEQFREGPPVFDEARAEFADCIDCWGYQENRAQYVAALQQADVFVSTADHEFFGLSAIEATLAGAYPLLPRRLAYPETFGLADNAGVEAFFYDGSPRALADKLAAAARSVAQGVPLHERTRDLRTQLKRFEWPALARRLDEAIAAATRRPDM